MTALKEQAITLHRQGKLEAAKIQYELYLQAYPEDADVHHALGVLLGQLNYHQDALRSIQRAIKINPNDAAAYNNLGNAYTRLNLVVDAENAYLKAIQLNETFADAFCNLGILNAKLEKNDSAIDYLKKATQLKLGFISATHQLSDLYLRVDRFDDTIRLLENHISCFPEDLESHHRLGIALFHLKRYEAAIHAFETVLSMNAKHPEANQYLANSLLQIGDETKALNYYFRQLSIESMVATYYNIGFLLMVQNKYQDALQYLLHAEQLDPNDIAIQLNLASIYLNQHKIESAIQHYEYAQKIKPNDLEIQHILSALMQKKTPDRAPTAYVEHLFDQYASYYDKHLTDCLHYTTPEQLFRAIETEVNKHMQNWVVVDLGCGTGLMGNLFKPHIKKLIGVDVSKNMLAIAREKKIYDELILGDIEQVLPTLHAIDCVVAADVLTYIGECSSLFEKVHSALIPGGIFAFTVEKTEKSDFVLQTSIRYAHRKQYLETLISGNHFTLLQLSSVVLRKQQNQPVEGYLVILEK